MLVVKLIQLNIRHALSDALHHRVCALISGVTLPNKVHLPNPHRVNKVEAGEEVNDDFDGCPPAANVGENLIRRLVLIIGPLHRKRSVNFRIYAIEWDLMLGLKNNFENPGVVSGVPVRLLIKLVADVTGEAEPKSRLI